MNANVWRGVHALAVVLFISGVFALSAIAVIGKLNDNGVRQNKGEYFASRSCLEGYTVDLTSDPITTLMDVYLIEILSIVFVAMLTWTSFTKFVTDGANMESKSSMHTRTMEYMMVVWSMASVAVIGLMVMFSVNSIMSDYSQPFTGFNNSLLNITNYTYFGITDAVGSNSPHLSVTTFDHRHDHIGGYTFYITFAVLVAASVIMDTAARLVLLYTNSKQMTSDVTKNDKMNNVVKYMFLVSTTVVSIMVLDQSYSADRIEYLQVAKPGPLSINVPDNFVIVSHQSEHADEWKFYSDACHGVIDDYSVVVDVIELSMWLVVVGASVSLVCNMIPDIHRLIKGPPKSGETPTFAENKRDISMLTVTAAVSVMGDFIFNVFGVLFVILVLFPFTYINCPAYNMIVKENRYYVTYSVVFTLLIFTRMGYFMVRQWK